MKQTNRLTKMEVGKRPLLSFNTLSLCKDELEKGLNDLVNLRKAYELIFEDSQYFYEQLTLAFNNKHNKTT